MTAEAVPAKKARGRGWRWLLVPLVLFGTVLLVKAFAVDIFLVVEQSMWPGLYGEQDRILVQRLAQKPRRWQIWLYESEDHTQSPLVKRVVGLADEFIDLRTGDLYVGPSPDRMRRLIRPPEVVDSLLVPVYPTPEGECGIGRFRVISGSMDGGGEALTLSDNVVAHLQGSLADNIRESIYDDYLDNEGGYQAGDHIVSDIRVDVRIDAIEGELQIWHDLKGLHERRALRIHPSGLSMRVGDFGGARVHPLPWDGTLPVALRMETVDGRFRVVRLDKDMKPRRVLIDEPRDTSVYYGYSRVRLVLEGGHARLSHLRVARDVYWAWPSRRGNVGAYHVDGGYFFLGDYAPVSEDSRKNGPVSHRRLVGRAWRIVWPTDRSRALP